MAEIPTIRYFFLVVVISTIAACGVWEIIETGVFKECVVIVCLLSFALNIQLQVKFGVAACY